VPSFVGMDTLSLTILRDRVAATVPLLGLVALLAACGAPPTTADVDFLPRPADAGVVEPDARHSQPSEEPCNTTQCDQFGGGQALPPTTFRRLVCDQAKPTSP
jgi:hypothetical protein